MDDTLKVIYVAASLEQARIMQSALSEEGIQAAVDNDALQTGVGELPMGWATAARVMVHQRDAARARLIALDFDRHGHDAALAADDLQARADSEDQVDWPCCPKCERRRLATCPVCETAGTDFAQGFLPDMAEHSPRCRHSDDVESDGDDSDEDDDGDAPLVLLCPTCDEPFVPEFPAMCEWCGYHFADGRQPAPLPSYEPSEMNARVWIVLVGLIGSCLATVLFFRYLLSQ